MTTLDQQPPAPCATPTTYQPVHQAVATRAPRPSWPAPLVAPARPADGARAGQTFWAALRAVLEGSAGR